jgi:hypothetical protein
MRNRLSDLAAPLTTGLSERLQDVVGNATILGFVALLALTAWVVCVAGIVVVLTPFWGLALALFFVALLVIAFALVLLAVLQRRTRLQKARAALRQAEISRKSRAALIAVLPGIVRNRPSALLIGSGLAIGAMIVAALQPQDEK